MKHIKTVIQSIALTMLFLLCTLQGVQAEEFEINIPIDLTHKDGFAEIQNGTEFELDITNVEKPDGANAPVIESKKLIQGKDNSLMIKSSDFNTLGTYVYKLQLREYDDVRMYVDPVSYKLEVLVTNSPDGSKKDIAYALKKDDDQTKIDRMTFKNGYARAATLSVGVKKIIKGEPLHIDQDIFEFAMINDTNAPLPEFIDQYTRVIKDENANAFIIPIVGEGENSFNNIVFDKEGEYVYHIGEHDGGLPNYKYDKTTYTLTVKVEFNNDHTSLVANSTLVNDRTQEVVGNTCVFVNEYTKKHKPTPTPEVTPTPSPDVTPKPSPKPTPKPPVNPPVDPPVNPPVNPPVPPVEPPVNPPIYPPVNPPTHPLEPIDTPLIEKVPNPPSLMKLKDILSPLGIPHRAKMFEGLAKTGDEFHIAMWASVLVVSIVMMVVAYKATRGEIDD